MQYIRINLRHRKHKNKQLENKLKPINISISDMDKVLKNELTKKRKFTKNTWHDSSYNYNYFPEPIQKAVGGVKDQILNFFKTKDYSKPEPAKIVYGGGRKQSEENIFKSKCKKSF